MDIGMLTQRAVALLQLHEPVDGYQGAFSGGKDSTVIKELAKMAGVKVFWHYHQTTIDPPEVLRFIKRYHPEVIWDKPQYGNFFIGMERRGYPTWKNRWCCEEYKERGILHGVTILGVRIAESRSRNKHWQSCVMTHFKTKQKVILPVRLWSDGDIWAFIRWRKLEYCELYDQGFKRLGCIGCPLASKKQRAKEFKRWPGFERRWRLSFGRIWARRNKTIITRGKNKGKEWEGSFFFKNSDELFDWWNDRCPNITKWLETKKQLELNGIK